MVVPRGARSTVGAVGRSPRVDAGYTRNGQPTSRTGRCRGVHGLLDGRPGVGVRRRADHFDEFGRIAEARRLHQNAVDALALDDRLGHAELVHAVAQRHEVLLDRVVLALAHLDVYAALAEVGVRNSYVRPTLTTEDTIQIVGGRHPVVEAAVAKAGERFVATRGYRARLLRRPSFARAVEEARPFRHFFPPGAPDRD